ncbi:MAG: type II toxin-antitoxin system PemK/MazF family toxin [Xanthobacteraceae bacterium]
MKRGDLVTVVLSGAYGKPRPAVIVQADRYATLDSITFLPLTSQILPNQVFRISISPTKQNGLQSESQVMTDKCHTLPLTKVGPRFGTLSAEDMDRVDRMLASFLGFA